jgi:hypothetical protein
VQQGAGGGTGGGCAETSSQAQSGVLPADIIVVVDNSGSMDLEEDWVQNNMNAMVTAITSTGIDAHVVMIDQNTCVPAPLGSGSCPNDENLPHYRHVFESIGSTNGLEKLLQTYPQWQPSLRANATKTIVIVTDDDSDLGAGAFTSQLVALDPTFMGFKFDGIVSFDDPILACLNFGPCCGISAAEGSVYKDLVNQTGGVIGDLCQQNFGPVFTDIATAVVSGSQIDCVYDIPDPGNGQMIDPTKVNVEYKPSPSAPEEPIYNVPGGAADCGPAGGWYYDDPTNPTQILLCPASCDHVQMSTDGSVSVIFGCETKIGPAE